MEADAVEPPKRSPEDLYTIVRSDPSAQYDVRELIACLVSGAAFTDALRGLAGDEDEGSEGARAPSAEASIRPGP